MESLFKYTKLDYIKSALYNGVYASVLTDVNDPYEWNGLEYAKDYRICCMTTSSRQMLMWSYYTHHSGCCIEYCFDESLLSNNIVRPVNYTDIYRNNRYLSLDEIYDHLYSKGKEWEHEKEVRAVWFRDDFDKKLWFVRDDLVFLKAKVRSVTFGILSDRSNEYFNVLKLYYTISPRKSQYNCDDFMNFVESYSL